MAAPAIAIALLSATAPAYEADTHVSDIAEPPFRPAIADLDTTAGAVSIGRVPSEDLTMHCRDEQGLWHRLHPNKLQTACGVAFTNWKAGNTRSGRYPDNPLAPCECWTRSERTEAEERDKPVPAV